MWYVDTSAALKLVIDEEHADAMRSWAFAHADGLVSADLLRTELVRAVRRTKPDAIVRARELLDSVALMEMPTVVYEHAAELDPALLRSLDALHLAAALRLGDDLDGIVVYNTRLRDAAEHRGIRVEAPGTSPRNSETPLR